MNVHPVWVGIAEVTRGPACKLDISEGTAGSFVWWAAQAMNAEDFKRRVEAACKHYHLVLYGFDDVQPALMLHLPAIYLAELVEKAEQDPSHVLYGTFHNYGRHNA